MGLLTTTFCSSVEIFMILRSLTPCYILCTKYVKCLISNIPPGYRYSWQDCQTSCSWNHVRQCPGFHDILQGFSAKTQFEGISDFTWMFLKYCVTFITKLTGWLSFFWEVAQMSSLFIQANVIFKSFQYCVIYKNCSISDRKSPDFRTTRISQNQLGHPGSASTVSLWRATPPLLLLRALHPANLQLPLLRIQRQQTAVRDHYRLPGEV